MPLQATSGAASYDAFGGGVPVVPAYIEDFFQSYLRTGTGASATVTTGLDGSTKETLVWTKSRSAATNHKLTDNVRGATKSLISNNTSAEATNSQGLTAFSSTGYTIGTDTNYNNSGATYVDWQWVSQPKFFDIVTWTHTGTNGRVINHSLGSTPGMIIVKNVTSGGSWPVWHRSAGTGQSGLYLQKEDAFSATNEITSVNSTSFTLSDSFDCNGDTGATGIAYLFAHNAGGFGLTGTDNVISCGSFTTPSSGDATITLGYEPQWLMVKRSDGTGDWYMVDTMRGLSQTSQARLDANLSSAEEVSTPGWFIPTATGFTAASGSIGPSRTFIYIAIRRGPMKVPTSGTSVFAQTSTTSATTPLTVTTNFPVDMAINRYSGAVSPTYVFSRLTGAASDGTRESVYLQTNSTAAETAPNAFGDSMVSNTALIDYAFLAGNSNAKIYWNFRRAPSFFDEVCYTGTGSATTFTHNLGVVPELIITKVRAGGPPDFGWAVYASPLGATKALFLDTTDAEQTLGAYWNDTAPTSSVFTVGNANKTNRTSYTYVAYLFATCAGVSKVGSYTGTATTLQVDCGFTGGARFVLIKRTDSTGDWYVWDSARGIVAGNDPYLLLNSTAAEVTNTDYVDTYSAGFEISSTAPAAINASGGTFIFLAIA